MSDDVKKGLVGVISDETKVSQVMPEINSLTYRGYAVQDLAKNCKFEEVAYLILNSELPNDNQLKQFEAEERANRPISDTLKTIIKNYPKNAHPMDTTRTSVSHMGLEDPDTL
jgi:2-methylcitrate synthase